MLVMHLLLNIFFSSTTCGFRHSYFSLDSNMSLSMIRPSFNSCGSMCNAMHMNLIIPSSVGEVIMPMVILILHIFIGNLVHKKKFFLVLFVFSRSRSRSHVITVTCHHGHMSSRSHVISLFIIRIVEFVVVKCGDDFMVCMVPNTNQLLSEIVVDVVSLSAQIRLSVEAE